MAAKPCANVNAKNMRQFCRYCDNCRKVKDGVYLCRNFDIELTEAFVKHKNNCMAYKHSLFDHDTQKCMCDVCRNVKSYECEGCKLKRVVKYYDRPSLFPDFGGE